MLLQNNTDLCTVNSSTLIDDPIFKSVIKNLTPNVVYENNQELFEAVGDTLVNYAPISINISDYWNKDTQEKIVVPLTRDSDLIFNPQSSETRPIFGLEDDVTNHGLSVGYFGEVQALEPDVITNNERCGFFINSTLTLQDTLAKIFVNNVYVVAKKTKEDPKIRRLIFSKFERLGVDPEDITIFDNINNLFTEQKYSVNKEFNESKGTKTAIKYATWDGWDAKIQGSSQDNKKFFVDVFEEEPLKYRVESPLIPMIFDTFVKPLTHPIGFDCDYRMVCNIFPEDNQEYVFCETLYTADEVSVIELCTSNKEPIPVPSDETVVCGITTSKNYVFATTDGTGLNSLISQDEGTGNILKNIETGIMEQGTYFNWWYTKYIFENNNYLIKYTEYIDGKINETEIEYYRYNNINWDLIGLFVNDRHVNIHTDNKVQIIENNIGDEFTSECVNEPVAWFAFEGSTSDWKGFGEGRFDNGSH